MIVVVTGSRALLKHPQRVDIKAEFLRTLHNLRPTELHHGGAAGPDAWAHTEFADIAVMHRPPKTSSYAEAAAALLQRNHDMINAALQREAWQRQAILVACWDGVSRGTKDAIDFADYIKMPVVFVPVGLIEMQYNNWGLR